MGRVELTSLTLYSCLPNNGCLKKKKKKLLVKVKQSKDDSVAIHSVWLTSHEIAEEFLLPGSTFSIQFVPL